MSNGSETFKMAGVEVGDGLEHGLELTLNLHCLPSQVMGAAVGGDRLTQKNFRKIQELGHCRRSPSSR